MMGRIKLLSKRLYRQADLLQLHANLSGHQSFIDVFHNGRQFIQIKIMTIIKMKNKGTEGKFF
jgi:hypothetical protein